MPAARSQGELSALDFGGMDLIPLIKKMSEIHSLKEVSEALAGGGLIPPF